jgi:putative tryptophan/tyrosine transport system substrate-binding protein
VALIVCDTATATLAVKTATNTIPIVFTLGGDPVEQLGFVASYKKPGGNITGVTSYSADLVTKRLEQLREVVPSDAIFAVLLNPKSAGAERGRKEVDSARRVLVRQILIFDASTEQEIDAAFASLAQQRVGALAMYSDPFINDRRDQIVALAARYSIPASYPTPDASVAGGLIGYGTSRANQDDLVRQVGVYAGRILKGEKPADLPIIQPTKFELVINLKTAKALGLTIPETLLATADEVIQ